LALRQYPDTEEVKARNVGMYKSPAHSVKKPNAPTSVKRIPSVAEEPLGIVMHAYMYVLCMYYVYTK